MDDTDALLHALGRTASPDVATAVARLVRKGADDDLVGLNPLSFAALNGLDEEAVVSGLLHASRLGLFEMSWNILCPSCGGVLDANTTLKSVRQGEYHCAFCSLAHEPTLDETVEVSFTVSPRVRRVAAHDPHSLAFWDYHRQVFFGSGVAFPQAELFESLCRAAVLDSVELAAGDRLILSLSLGHDPLILFDPVSHSAHLVTPEGEATAERRDISIVFDPTRPSAGASTLQPGPIRLSLDNRTAARVLPGVFVANESLETLLGGRRPFLTAKRLLTNQTFRDLYRTDTLDVDQRLKITSLTFLFTDLTGSTALYERVGDLVAYDIVRAHFRILAEIAASERGAVIKTIGDAVMATFPTPSRALCAAMRMREAMRQLNAERGSRDVVLKIGLHEGPCLAVMLNERQDFFGQTVNIASRVQELAGSDGILATETVLRHPDSRRVLAERGVEPRPRADSLRDIGDRLPVFELGAGGTERAAAGA